MLHVLIMTNLQMYNSNSKNSNFTLFKHRTVVLSIDLLYEHLQVSSTYPLGLVRFSMKIVEFQILFVKK